MRWNVLKRRRVYESEWVDVWVDEVEANGTTFDHHVLEMPKRTVSVVAVDDGNVLLMWRHRFTTDTWGWEVPAGWVEAGEDLEAAARRETEEETGWRAGTITPLITYNVLAGISSLRMNTFLATDLTRTGPASDHLEASHVEWVPVERIPSLARDGQISDGVSLTALTYFLMVHPAADEHGSSS